ncbi:hypothetical protein PMAYCL1PPCAC_08164, partial [Pristionchus mayeri]
NQFSPIPGQQEQNTFPLLSSFLSAPTQVMDTPTSPNFECPSLTTNTDPSTERATTPMEQFLAMTNEFASSAGNQTPSTDENIP